MAHLISPIDDDMILSISVSSGINISEWSLINFCALFNAFFNKVFEAGLKLKYLMWHKKIKTIK